MSINNHSQLNSKSPIFKAYVCFYLREIFKTFNFYIFQIFKSPLEKDISVKLAFHLLQKKFRDLPLE